MNTSGKGSDSGRGGYGSDGNRSDYLALDCKSSASFITPNNTRWLLNIVRAKWHPIKVNLASTKALFVHNFGNGSECLYFYR